MTPATLGLLFLLGTSLAAAPGALNVETLRRGARHGFRAAVVVQVGALLGDAVYVGLTAGAVLLGLQVDALLPACMLLGGGALLWTAFRIVHPAPGGDADGPPDPRRGLALGAALALSSPLTLVFWAAVTGLLDTRLGRGPTAVELALVALVYAASVLLWAGGLSAVAAWGRRLARPRLARLLHVTCAGLLALWGVQLLATAAVAMT